MARNYRKVSGGISAWELVCRIVLFLLFVAFGLSIVMQETRTQKIGTDIKNVEEQITRLRSANMMLKAQASDLKTPRSLIQKIEDWRLNLHPISDMQVVKCAEPGESATQLYAKTMIAQANQKGGASRSGARGGDQPAKAQLRR